MSESNLQTIIIIGHALGNYENADVSKEFSGNMLCIVRPNGSLIVQNMSMGIRPICYIGEGAEISMARNIDDAEIELIASTEDEQYLTLKFDEVFSLCGVPNSENEIDSAALTILRATQTIDGKYGRVKIARMLTGSTSKSVLTMDINELRSYGTLRSMSQKETLHLIDWLLEEGYLGYDDKEQYPTIHISEKGIKTILDLEHGADHVLSIPDKNKELSSSP